MDEDRIAFTSLADLPGPRPGELLFRESWRGKAAAVALFLALSAGGFAWPSLQFGGEAPGMAVAGGVWVGGWLLVFALLPLAGLRGALGPHGWVLRADGERLLVNLRSFMNRKLPPTDPVVLVVPRRSVRFLRVVRQAGLCIHVARRGRVSENPVARQFLDIHLDGGARPVTAALREEAGRRAPLLGGGFRFGHSAVRVRPGGVVRVVWRDENSRLTPSLDAARRLLAPWYRFAEEQREKEPRLADLTEGEREERLIAMVESGERLQATALARELYGFDLTEAKRFVEDLAGRGS